MEVLYCVDTGSNDYAFYSFHCVLCNFYARYKCMQYFMNCMICSVFYGFYYMCYILLYTLNYMHYIVLYPLYYMHCILCILLYSLYAVHCRLQIRLKNPCRLYFFLAKILQICRLHFWLLGKIVDFSLILPRLQIVDFGADCRLQNKFEIVVESTIRRTPCIL